MDLYKVRSVPMSEQLHSIEEVLQDLKAGKPVIIVDDESRENEGDLIIVCRVCYTRKY